MMLEEDTRGSMQKNISVNGREASLHCKDSALADATPRLVDLRNS
jgi:hypothetical protein